METYDAATLKSLSFGRNVVRTPETDRVIFKLDKYFTRAKRQAIVTSVLRTKESQLAIIRDYAIKCNLMPDGDTLDTGQNTCLGGKIVPRWQALWSMLLNRNIIVNPPVPAVVLLDYWKGGVNKKGQTIQPSAHFLGTAFDIGGGPNGAEDEFAIVRMAARDGIGIKITPSSPMLERANNCVHSIIG